MHYFASFLCLFILWYHKNNNTIKRTKQKFKLYFNFLTYLKNILYENPYWIIPYSVVGFGRKLNPTLVINFSMDSALIAKIVSCEYLDTLS